MVNELKSSFTFRSFFVWENWSNLYGLFRQSQLIRMIVLSVNGMLHLAVCDVSKILNQMTLCNWNCKKSSILLYSPSTELMARKYHSSPFKGYIQFLECYFNDLLPTVWRWTSCTIYNIKVSTSPGTNSKKPILKSE